MRGGRNVLSAADVAALHAGEFPSIRVLGVHRLIYIVRATVRTCLCVAYKVRGGRNVISAGDVVALHAGEFLRGMVIPCAFLAFPGSVPVTAVFASICVSGVSFDT